MDAGIRGGASAVAGPGRGVRCRALLLLGALALSTSACGEDAALSGAAGALAIRATEVVFPATYVGHPTRESLDLRNTGRAAISVELSLTGPFGSERNRVELAGGELFPLPLAFDPRGPGFASGTLLVAFDGVVTEVPLSGLGLATPDCFTDDPCARTDFEPASGSCRTIPAAPFSPCTSGNLCQEAERCLGGRCVGVTVGCDDENVCTADGCNPSSGCTHRDDSANCPGSGNPCRVAACDRSSGCGLVDARDGTACGAADCATAHVCIVGSCRELETPEGTPCLASCGPGQCQGGSCFRREGELLDELFRVDAAPEVELGFAGVTDPEGDLFFRESYGGGCNLASVGPDGVLRFRDVPGACFPAQPLLVSGDRLWLASGAVVQARGRDGGAWLFSSDLWQELEPELALGCPACSVEVVALADAGAHGIAAAVAVRGLLEPRGHLALISARGELTFALPQAGELREGSLLAGADGTLFLGLVSFGEAKPRGELVAVDPRSGERWRRALSARDLPPRLAGTAEGVVILGSGQVLRSDDGGDAYLLPLPPGVPSLSPLLTAGLGYWLTGLQGAPVLHAFDPVSGVALADLGVAPFLSRPAVGFADPLLTASGSALLLTSPGETRHELLELQAGPGAVRRCEVPADGAVPRDGVRLVGEQLVLQVHGPDGFSLRSYRLPGSDAAPSGWTGPGGNLGGGRRPE